jgi:hypothetical protein
MRAQSGAAATMVLVLLVMVAVIALSVWLVSRLGENADERKQTQASLEAAAAALDSFAAGNDRLPCPADPAADDGVEIRAVKNCTTILLGIAGTLPWKTIGLARSLSLDAWGRKISYRVYSGADGLTQDRGASMANCDTNEIAPSGVSGNGLCKPDPVDNVPASRSTTPDQFLAGKGLKLTFFGRDLSPPIPSLTIEDPTRHVAYVLISHGPTGQGGYTISGVQLDGPASNEEKDNLKPAGDFTAMAFSGPEVGINNNKHFDDMLIYRTISDLVKNANIAPRNWPDATLTVAAATFDRATLQAALGKNPGSDTGTSTIALNGVTVTALDASGNTQNISFNNSTNDGIGGVSGGDELQSGVGGPDESLRLVFGEYSRQFAFALDAFGYDEASGSPVRWEQVQLKFYDAQGSTATLKATIAKTACLLDPSLTTFSVDAGVDFNRVDVSPLPTSGVLAARASGFFLSEVRTCKTGAACHTALETAHPASLCP